MITSYVTLAGHKEFQRSKTGFGYMVYDIARAVAATEEVDIFAAWSRGTAFSQDGVHFLPRSLWLFISNIFHCVSISKLFRALIRFTGNFGTLVRYIYCWMLTGYLGAIIKKGSYDIVHIHGCSPLNELWIDVCYKNRAKFIITLHGLDSFSDSVSLDAKGKQYERDLIKRVIVGEFPITVISSGIKRIIEQTYDVYNLSNLYVVCNAFSFDEANCPEININIRERYSIKEDSKVIVCVGNVCRRKNQGQLIKAFDLLPQSLAQQTYILFLGGTFEKEYSIGMLSEKSRWSSHFITCGIIPKEEVGCFYDQCNAVALMSLSEGFGLSLIEGMHFGRPSMSFSDIDAFDDIYSPNAMVGVDIHSDEAVSKGMEKLLTKEWNEEIIKEHSKKFESRGMANNYINVYRKL